MAEAFLLYFAEEERKQNVLRLERRRLRDACDPMQLPDNEFLANFRVNKCGFQQIYDEISVLLPSTQRTTAVPNELKILAAMNFYANGCYQKNICSSYLTNMSQPTFSKCLREVTNALNESTILKKYIKFPFRKTERERIMSGFMKKFSFPGIIGCIDGTHVALVQPKEHEEAYFNRKNYHSLNVLIICDSDLNIIHVDASHGGAAHDSFVWNGCKVKPMLQNLDQNGEHCWLLGDSGYAQRPWMMTPILGASPGTPEEYYTTLHCQARNTVERCIGVLKARWRCLLAHRVLHYDPVTVAKIVNACVVLHNIAIMQNISAPELQEEIIHHTEITSSYEHRDVNQRRAHLVHRLWGARHSTNIVAPNLMDP